MTLSFAAPRLGEPVHLSPLQDAMFLDDHPGILVDATAAAGAAQGAPAALEIAGPRRHLFFDPADARIAIATCGGLCPGLNDVVRALTMVSWYRYGVRSILGIRYGYEGMVPGTPHLPVALTPEDVEDIHQNGGTILGTSRGHQEPAAMTDFLSEHGISVLFAIGGDGTQRGALQVAEEIRRRNLPISVIGIPKTIDNDISYTERTFGFETAVAMSRGPITCAHMEAKGVQNGVGLVKLMGREAGFVAAYATLASSDVNLVLIPEVPFRLERVLQFLDERLRRKSHAVIVVAEGAGQDLVPASGTDASGNRLLGDIGPHLKNAVADHFRRAGRPINVRYIDPSYTIRSARAEPDDSVFCFQLAENAVHAALTGRTGMLVGLWNGHFVHVPMARAVAERKRIDPHGSLWQSVLDNTGQPPMG